MDYYKLHFPLREYHRPFMRDKNKKYLNFLFTFPINRYHPDSHLQKAEMWLNIRTINFPDYKTKNINLSTSTIKYEISPRNDHS